MAGTVFHFSGTDASAEQTVEVVPAAVRTMEAEPWIEKVHTGDRGLLAELRATVGQKVHEGELMATLEDTVQRHAYERARLNMRDDSSVRIAEANLAKSNAELREIEAKVRRRQASDLDVQKAASDLKIAEARLDSAIISHQQKELQYEEAKRNLEKRRIRAPMDGVVLEVMKGRGEDMKSGEHLFTVIDPAKVKLNMVMPASSARNLQVGQTVPVRQGSTGMHRLARVDSIHPAADSESGEQEVILSMDHPPNQHPIEPANYDMAVPEESTAMFPY